MALVLDNQRSIFSASIASRVAPGETLKVAAKVTLLFSPGDRPKRRLLGQAHWCCYVRRCGGPQTYGVVGKRKSTASSAVDSRHIGRAGLGRLRLRANTETCGWMLATNIDASARRRTLAGAPLGDAVDEYGGGCSGDGVRWPTRRTP